MWRGVEQAAALLLSGDRELYCILAVTARMSLCSSLLALALGAPAGILLGSCRFPGRRVLVARCRALAGMGRSGGCGCSSPSPSWCWLRWC